MLLLCGVLESRRHDDLWARAACVRKHAPGGGAPAPRIRARPPLRYLSAASARREHRQPSLALPRYPSHRTRAHAHPRTKPEKKRQERTPPPPLRNVPSKARARNDKQSWPRAPLSKSPSPREAGAACAGPGSKCQPRREPRREPTTPALCWAAVATQHREAAGFWCGTDFSAAPRSPERSVRRRSRLCRPFRATQGARWLTAVDRRGAAVELWTEAQKRARAEV